MVIIPSGTHLPWLVIAIVIIVFHIALALAAFSFLRFNRRQYSALQSVVDRISANMVTFPQNIFKFPLSIIYFKVNSRQVVAPLNAFAVEDRLAGIERLLVPLIIIYSFPKFIFPFLMERPSATQFAPNSFQSIQLAAAPIAPEARLLFISHFPLFAFRHCPVALLLVKCFDANPSMVLFLQAPTPPGSRLH